VHVRRSNGTVRSNVGVEHGAFTAGLGGGRDEHEAFPRDRVFEDVSLTKHVLSLD
jgi:hypothetical protein